MPLIKIGIWSCLINDIFFIYIYDIYICRRLLETFELCFSGLYFYFEWNTHLSFSFFPSTQRPSRLHHTLKSRNLPLPPYLLPTPSHFSWYRSLTQRDWALIFDATVSMTHSKRDRAWRKKKKEEREESNKRMEWNKMENEKSFGNFWWNFLTGWNEIEESSSLPHAKLFDDASRKGRRTSFVSRLSAVGFSCRTPHYGTKPGHFETSKIHLPTSKGVSEVSERANEWAVRANERVAQ